MLSAELRVSFDGKDHAGRDAEVVATVHFASGMDGHGHPPVVFALPGAGYNRQYFDLRLDGHEGYSQSEYHVARGAIIVTMECVGAGDSHVSNEAEIDFGTIAYFHDRAVAEICRRLKDGSVDDALPPLASFQKIGLGQSLGGAVTLITQARHQTFDSVCLLGVSALHGVLPQPDPPPGNNAAEGQTPIDWVYAFHSDDTPRDIVDLDLAGGYPDRQTVPPFGTRRIPACTFDLLAGPGVLTADASHISVPVFIGVGDRDSSTEPHAEPSGYPNSSDVSVLIVPRMSHMHNFAGTRKILWRRLDLWWRAVAGQDAAQN